jgi:hypothetical protein
LRASHYRQQQRLQAADFQYRLQTPSLFSTADAAFNINTNTSYRTTRAVAQAGQTTTARNESLRDEPAPLRDVDELRSVLADVQSVMRGRVVIVIKFDGLNCDHQILLQLGY